MNKKTTAAVTAAVLAVAAIVTIPFVAPNEAIGSGSIQSTEQGVSLIFDANTPPERVVWQAWLVDEAQLFTFDWSGVDDPVAADGFLIPASVLAQLEGREAIVQAIVPGVGKIAEIRINEPDAATPPATVPPRADAELMLNVVIDEGGAWANIIGLKNSEGGDVELIPITNVEVTLPAELVAQLDRIEAALQNAPTPQPQPQPTPGSGVNINTATYQEILSIPGIGPVKAGALITARDTPTFTPFVDWQDLQSRVSGIGPSTLADIQASGATIGPVE